MAAMNGVLMLDAKASVPLNPTAMAAIQALGLSTPDSRSSAVNPVEQEE